MEDRPKYRNGGIHKYDGYASPPLFGEELRDYETNHPYVSALDTMPVVPSKSLTELEEEFNKERPTL